MTYGDIDSLAARVQRVTAETQQLQDEGPAILREFRSRNNLSLTKLEQLTGIARSNLCNMEIGRRAVSAETLSRLVDAGKRIGAK